MAKKEKGNWVDRLKAGVKYHLSGKAMTEKAEQELREKRLAEIKAKLAAKKKPNRKKKSKATKRTKQIESGSAKGDFDKMRGNY